MSTVSHSLDDAPVEAVGGLRREVVGALRVLESDDADLTRIVRMSARLFGAESAFVGLIEGEQVRYGARLGQEIEHGPAAGSFAAAVVGTPDIDHLIILDAHGDPRYAEASLKNNAPAARFLAGAPITVHGQKIGALVVLSPEPRAATTPADLVAFADFAALAGALFELKSDAAIRARMAADLIKEEWRHALTLEAGKVGSWVWDVRTGEIVCNDIFRRMFGLVGVEPLRVENLFDSIDRADVERVKEAVRATFDEGVDYAVEFRVAATARWLIGRGRVYQRDAAGKPLVMMGVNIDVTDARESAEQMRLLLRELNHRVKNTLAMIQSLARQTLRQKPDPHQFIDAFSGRLRTLSDSHALLSDRDWSGIGLVELLEMQVQPYALDWSRQVRLGGGDVQLPPDHALGLGLIIHELASNAARFGALSVPSGRVEVDWSVNPAPERRLDLRWRECGGPAVMAPAEAGFGTRLIQRSLDKVIGSSVGLDYPETGVVGHISMPLD